jgi:glycosyltransferase involved in cell wall biosynthesis
MNCLPRIKIALLAPSCASWVRQDISILRELGNEVIFLRLDSSLYYNIRLLFHYALLAKSVDIIFCWFALPSGLFGVVFGKLFKKPCVVNAVGGDVAYVVTDSFKYGAATSYFMRPFLVWCLRNATKVIAISNESAKNAKRWGAKLPVVIYEGIDISKFQPFEVNKDKSKYILLTVATLNESNAKRKGIEFLLKAIQNLSKKYYTKLVIVGEVDDRYYPILMKRISELGIEDNVLLKGRVSEAELLYLYNQCDIFVLPSLHEGFPTVASEAQACEKPVVSTNSSSIPEVIINGETGLLVKPGDVEQLTDAIASLLDYRDRRIAMGKRGRKRIADFFSKDIRKRKIADILQDLLLQYKPPSLLKQISESFLSLIVLISWLLMNLAHHLVRTKGSIQ